MASTERVTVTLPKDLVKAVDQIERNRSRFVTKAVENELERRRREALMRSLLNPHPDAQDLADTDIDSWSEGVADDEYLVDMDAGTPVRWVEGKGWIEEPD